MIVVMYGNTKTPEASNIFLQDHAKKAAKLIYVLTVIKNIAIKYLHNSPACQLTNI